MPAGNRKRARKHETCTVAGPFLRSRPGKRRVALLLVFALFAIAATALLNAGSLPLAVSHRFAGTAAARWIGTGVLALAISAMLAAYVLLFVPAMVRRPVRVVVVTMLLLLMTGISRWLLVSDQPRLLVCLPACFTAIVLAVAYKRRLALIFAAVQISLICLAAEEGSLLLAMTLAAGCAAAIFDLSDVRNRSKLIRAGVLSGGAFLVAAGAAGLVAGVDWVQTLRPMCWAGGSGVATGFLALGLLPFLERLFGVCTSVSLLELCDPNQPLLRRLALEAPGTYNHSLQIGTLSEAAAEAIGANGLLARVGSMFHDVGKLNKPHYFIENRSERESSHGQLSPAMSTLVIIAHAREGVEMAREYGLPTQLHEFIATHHGTTVVEYFYTEARREDPDISRDDFRYGGPKPKSKEAAVVMLADMVESAARTLSEPTPKRIGTLVAELVHKRREDGQLDECELTLAEVRQIESSLVKSLTGIYHGRIKYPSTRAEKDPNRSANAG